MSSVGQLVEEEVIGVSGDRGRLELVSETLSVGVKGREGKGHECSFCCKCWTDE